LKELLAAACEMDDKDALDEMHVSTFERLMRTTAHDLLAIQPEKPVVAAAKMTRCKAFLLVSERSDTAINRAHFSKVREADEVLCEFQALVDLWNQLKSRLMSRLMDRFQSSSNYQTSCRSLRARFSHI